MSNFDGEIKIKSWIKKIKINDNGDFLCINLADSDLIKTLIEFAEQSDKKFKQLKEELKNKTELERIKMSFEFNTEIAHRTDEILGKGTCLKVFNVSVPFVMDITVFLNQLVDILLPYMEERNQYMDGISKSYIEKAAKLRERR